MDWTDVASAAVGHRAPRVRHAALVADPRSESALETKVRLLLLDGDLPSPSLQLEVGRFRVDLAYPTARLAVEVDGRAHHAGALEFARDRARQNALVLAGWTVLRFTAADVRQRPRAVVAAVRAALARAAGHDWGRNGHADPSHVQQGAR